jgi:HAD superfamily hydrolase (TIGR01509 family)
MTLARPPSGLLLDMDGTLVDSERLWFEAEQAAVARLGGDLPASEEPALVGLDTDALVARLRARHVPDVDPNELLAAILDALAGVLTRVAACPGAGELVAAALGHGLRCAVVSNSPAEVVRRSLASHPWADALTVRVSADDVARPKPAPDAYLLALERLSLDAESCVAVEDSPTGARAATAAGLRCLGVAADAEQRRALGRHTPHVVESLEAARRWLALDGMP